jgi:hypothetical protein
MNEVIIIQGAAQSSKASLINQQSSSIKFIWMHKCHGLLGHFNNIDDLIKKVIKAPYPVPNVQKLRDTFQTQNTFSYAASLITIEKVSNE